MSMREYPTRGYTVNIESVYPLLTNEQTEYLKSRLEDGDLDEIALFIENTLDYLPDFDVFRPSETDTCDDNMQEGEFYLIFDENDLFERKPKDVLVKMIENGMQPTLCNWSVWG